MSYACQKGHWDVMKYFIEVHKCNVKARDSKNITLFFIASFFGQLKVVQYFIDEMLSSISLRHSSVRLLQEIVRTTHNFILLDCGQLKVVQYFVEEFNMNANMTALIKDIPDIHLLL